MNQRRTVVVLLTVIAALLTVNIVVMGSRSAEARPAKGDGEPYVVKWLPNEAGGRYFQLWSDGQLDEWRTQGGCDFQVRRVIGSAGHPFEVVDAESSLNGVLVEYADGRLDLIGTTNPTVRCTLRRSNLRSD